MKVNQVLIVLITSILLCSYDPHYDPESIYKPVLMTRPQLESSIKSDVSQEMKNPGKIYMKDQFIFIVEKYKGIHIIDNSDRLNPVKKGFIHIPGCIDIAMKGNTLYADNAVDLVSIDLLNFPEITVTSRIQETFSELSPPDQDYIPYNYTKGNRPENTIIVAWEER